MSHHSDQLPMILSDATVRGDTLSVDLYYPRSEEVRYVEVGLVEVRAADSIRISYDFDRDGYKIEQASIFEWDGGDNECDPDWQEVAFVPAWGREQEATS